VRRTLIVLRHAKSAYPAGVADHDRPLGPRGVLDAPAAGRWIREHVGVPDHVVVSSARRTRGTWTLAAPAIGYIGAAGYEASSPGPLTIDPRVYDASAADLLEVVRELPDRVRCAVLVGHNPGCEDLVDVLVGDRDAEAARLLAVKYPTSGVAVLSHGGSWSALMPGQARLEAFAVPRG
jgi:phosphohistidine phosphatase